MGSKKFQTLCKHKLRATEQNGFVFICFFIFGIQIGTISNIVILIFDRNLISFHPDEKIALKALCASLPEQRDMPFQDIIDSQKSFNEIEKEMNVVNNHKDRDFLSSAKPCFESIQYLYQREIKKLQTDFDNKLLLWKPCFEKNKKRLIDVYENYQWYMSNFIFVEKIIFAFVILHIILYNSDYFAQNRIGFMIGITLWAVKFYVKFYFWNRASNIEALKNLEISSLL